MKVIIPLAGPGTRLRPHTHTKPKPMLLIAGKPGISYILDELKNLDVSEVIFITGHLRHEVEKFIKKHYDFFKARFIEQKEINGTAGAVRLAQKYIDEPVMIIMVDTVFEADLNIINKLKEDEAGIIWTKEVEDYKRFGVCVLDKQGYLQRIIEKPDKPISKLANIGLYYIKDYKLMFEGIKHLFDNNITLKGEHWIVDAFTYMVKQGAKIICPEAKGWYDFGKPETLLESNRELLKKDRHKEVKTENSVIIPPVHIADDVKIKGSTIGPYVAIARGAEIINSTVKNSVIGEKTKLDKANLEESIIGDESQVTGSFKNLNIGDHCVVRSLEEKK